MIRPITADDIPWIVSLCQRRYGLLGYYDFGAGLVALTQAMRLTTAQAIRSDHGFLVADVEFASWKPKRRECHVLAICIEEGHHWEAAKLLRVNIVWAREQGCVRWLLSSETEHGVASLADRVGARVEPRYVIDLEEASDDK